MAGRLALSLQRQQRLSWHRPGLVGHVSLRLLALSTLLAWLDWLFLSSSTPLDRLRRSRPSLLFPWRRLRSCRQLLLPPAPRSRRLCWPPFARRLSPSSRRPLEQPATPSTSRAQNVNCMVERICPPNLPQGLKPKTKMPARPRDGSPGLPFFSQGRKPKP